MEIISVNLCPFWSCTNFSIGYITITNEMEETMILQLALILVAIAVFSTLWAIAELLFLDIFLSDSAKLKRSKSVRKRFDK